MIRACAFVVVVVMMLGVMLGAVSAAAQAQRNISELGLDMVQWSKKVDERRYVSGRDWEGTLKHFRDLYRGNRGAIRWSREVSLPTVKYVHIASLVDKTAWQGVNIYQLRNGEVRIFVLPREPAPGSAAK